MKLKINFGKGGLKGFVSQHAEKAIFGLVLALVAFFIYSSATQEVDETGSPEELKRNASSARSGLNQDYWDEIRPEREKKVENYGDRVKVARVGIVEKDYALSNIWDKKLFREQADRGDPRLLPPEQVVASGGVFNIPMRTSSRVDPWADDKDAVAKPKEEAKPRPKRSKRKKTNRRSSDGSDEAMLSGSGAFYQDAGAEMGGDYPGSGMNEEMGPAPMMSRGGMTGGKRTIGKGYKDQYVSGYEGSFGRGGQGALGKSVAAVGVRALVPYEKQWEEYERALAESTGYSRKQDIPRYLFFLAERAEVPTDPNAPLEWQPISNSNYAMKLSARYAAFPKEIVDDAYVVPGALTMPIPPIVLKSYTELADHSEIPRRQVKRVQASQRKEEPADTEEPLEIGKPDLSEGIPVIPKTGRGATGGGGMYSLGDAGGMADTEGYPSGSGASMDYETGDYGNAEGGADYGSGGGYGSPYSTAQDQPVVKYKMVRFFDLTAEPGKSYRYRVAVVLEDPNHPQNPKASPSKRILATDVVQRVQAVEAKDEETSRRTGKRVRTYYLQTDWSEPSDIVTIAKPEKYVAGSATHGKVIPLSDGIKVQTTESKGKLVTMVWDESRAAEVPAETEVYRGSFLSVTQDADVLHPLTLQVKTIEGYEFGTDAFVADLRGGEELITDVEEVGKEKIETKYSVPGEFLVINGAGELLACNEIDDTEEYRRLMLIEDKEQMGAASQGYGMPPGDYADMMDFGDMGSGMEDAGSSEHGE